MQVSGHCHTQWRGLPPPQGRHVHRLTQPDEAAFRIGLSLSLNVLTGNPGLRVCPSRLLCVAASLSQQAVRTLRTRSDVDVYLPS